MRLAGAIEGNADRSLPRRVQAGNRAALEAEAHAARPAVHLDAVEPGSARAATHLCTPLSHRAALEELGRPGVDREHVWLAQLEGRGELRGAQRVIGRLLR